MFFEVFVLCDAANDSLGKLNLLGVFDTITVKLPGIHPLCVIAARIRFNKDENGEHVFSIGILNPDETVSKVILNKKIINVVMENSHETACVNLILSIVGLELTQYGTHRIYIEIDGIEKISIPLYIKSSN